MADVNETLAARGERYGDFATHAKITQGLKQVFVDSPKWRTLTASMKEALDMVAHKIGRILNGDPTYGDSWHDIAGYATLVEQELGEPVAAPVRTGTAFVAPEREPVVVSETAPAQAPVAPPALVGSPALNKALASAPSAPLPPPTAVPAAPVAPLAVPPKVTK